MTKIQWPAKFPDSNIIENIWGFLARRVYERGKKYTELDDLEEFGRDNWGIMDNLYFQSMYMSVSRRLMSVIDRLGDLKIINC